MAKRIALSAIVAAIFLSLAACGSPQTASTSASAAATSANAVQGSEPLVLIVVGFAGDANGNGALPYQPDYNWHELVFENNNGVSAYYSNQSNGSFTWVPARETSAFQTDGNTCAADAVNDGIVHVTLPRSHGHWFANDHEGENSQNGQTSGTSGTYTYDSNSELGGSRGADFDTCMADALSAASAYIDYSAYDTDSNGALSNRELGVGIIVAGYEIDGDWMNMLDDAQYPRLQAHANNFSISSTSVHGSPLPEDTVVMAETATSVPMERYEDTVVDPSVLRTKPNSLATLDHELGHYLGLPDYYDTTYNVGAAWANWTPGILSVMDMGAVVPVLNDEGALEYEAVSFDPFSLAELGWAQPQTVSSSGTYELRAAGATGGKNVLRVETDRKGEYFLIENRQATGQDAGLAEQFENDPAGGIVVWHVDENVYEEYLEANMVNYPQHRPALTVQYMLARSANNETAHTLSFTESAAPDTTSAFWSASNAQRRFSELGIDAFELWTYGAGEKADSTKERRYCGIKLRFPDASADVMHVEIALP